MLYRCRLCGQEFANGHWPNIEAALAIHLAQSGQNPMSLFALHINCEQGIGVGDLIGARLDNEQGEAA